MLLNRQKQILANLYVKRGHFLTAKELSLTYKVSLRTIKNDLVKIKMFLHNKGAHLLSISSKGHQLLIDNPVLFLSNFEQNKDARIRNSAYEQSSRINHVIRKLINNKNVNPDKLIDELFISRSTLSNDLKIIRKNLEKYDINVLSSRTKGLSIIGKEENVRRCIIKENLLRVNTESNLNGKKNVDTNETFSEIKNILLQVFITNKIVVSDYVFQNLVVHIYTSLWRMKSNYYITPDTFTELDVSYRHIQLVAQEIMKNICLSYDLQYSRYESNLLAINIQGKRELFEKAYISKEIDDFIFQTLTVIKNQFQIDFIDDLDLRISLALHTNPLISRMNSNLLLKNSITLEIKQNYIFVFDIASTFANELYKKYSVKISEDEISYIALHFANAMQSRTLTARLKVLLISPERKSNTFLVRQKFNQWFKEDIQSFDIVNPSQLETINISNYDAIFTTDKTISIKYDIIFIDLFLNESNYQRIEFALNGFHSAQDIINIFHKELFFNEEFSSKKEIIDYLCAKVKRCFNLDESLHQSIKERETINVSYFGHTVAILHPISPITESTFISTLVLKEPVDWDGSVVRFVLLVSIEKNNPKALSLWYYLSFLISNQKLIDEIIQNPTHSHFSDLLMSLYKNILGHSSNDQLI